MESLWRSWNRQMWERICVLALLSKNPGGGLAPIGGYIVGKEEYINQCAYRLTAPGLGKEDGSDAWS